MTHVDSYQASQCINNVLLTRLFFTAKHSTSPCQLVPGVGTQRRIHSKVDSLTRRVLIPRISRKNGCQPHARMPSHNQRAYNSRSANTITCHSGGIASWMELSIPSQCGRQEPSFSPFKTFHATGIAQPLTTTLMTRIVQRFRSVVASRTRATCLVSLFHNRTTYRNRGAKQLLTSRSRRLSPLFCSLSRYHSRKR